MPTKQFIQDSRFGRKTLKLENKCITVFGGSGSKKFEVAFDLRDVAPHFERTREYRYSFIAVLLVVAILSSISFFVIVRFGIFSENILPAATSFFATFVAILLWQTIRGFAPVEIVRFRSKQGIVLFDVVKEKRQSEEFERFVAELCECIRAEEP